MKPASSPFVVARWVVTLLAALAATFLRTAAFFNPRTTLDEISLTAALALGAGFLCYLVFPFLWEGLSFAWMQRLSLRSAKPPDFAQSLETLDSAFSRRWTFLLAWVLGGLNAYFLTAFFRHFYPAPFQVILLSAIFVTLSGLVFFELLEVRRTRLNEIAPGGGQSRLIGFISGVRYDAPALLAFLLAGGLALASIRLCFQFPEIFDRSLYLLDKSAFRLFLIGVFLSVPLLGWILSRWENRFAEKFRAGKFHAFLSDHFAGILLALFFFIAYFAFATVVNFPGYQTVDLFFDSDSTLWLIRMARDPSETNPVRGAHPYILLLLRPLTWMVSLLFNGNRTFAAFAVNAGAGALCVFFTWRFFQRLTGHSAYALTFAALLGASLSTMLFSSFLETYIFSALALIVFLNLLLAENPSLPALVATGLVVFGITVTNLVQTAIVLFLTRLRHCEEGTPDEAIPSRHEEEIALGEYALAMTKRRGSWNQISNSIKIVIKYALIVVLLAVGLSLLQAWMFPGTRVFFIPSNLLSEQKFGVDLTGENAWKITGRLLLLARSLFFYNIVASEPLILTQELGTPFPNFRTFYASKGNFIFSSYAGLSDALVKVWVVILIAAGIVFVWNLVKSPRSLNVRFSAAMLLCLGFNFALHLAYGDDPLLYSADWTYALIFFVGLSLQKWADKKWLIGFLLAFIALLMFNNLGLFANILHMSAPLFPLK